MKPLTTTVRSCARCGDDHPRMEFKLFTRPSGPNTHWALCPKNGEPVLLRLAPTEG